MRRVLWGRLFSEFSLVNAVRLRIAPHLFRALSLPILLSVSNVAHADQAPGRVESQAAQRSYSSLLKDLDTRITSFRKLAAERPKEWPFAELVGKALQERALLTGRVEDLGEAARFLDAAFQVAPKGSGPAITAAKVNLSLHKLGESERYLEISQNWKILPVRNRAANFQLAGTIKLYKGDYEAAIANFRDCELLLPGHCLSDIANYYLNTSGFSEAEAIYQRQLASTESRQFHHRAWLNLQLAIVMMKRGQYELAMGYLLQADQELPGWWLVKEHIAEVSALLGRPEKAIEIYQQVIADTNLPQFMDALAGVYSAAGREKEARALTLQARNLWLEKLNQYPEALSGHALEHFLSSESDKELALDLAEKNHKNRPWGESKLMLAEAYLATNNPAKAAALVEQIIGSRYRSAEVFEVAARTYEALGEPAKAKEYQRLCGQINPKLCRAEPTQGTPPVS